MFTQQFVQWENTPMNTHSPQVTGEKESQTSREYPHKQTEELRGQLEMQKDESKAFQKDMLKIISGIKTLSQAQFEEWKKIFQKQHEEETSLLLEEKAEAFSALKRKVREAMEEEKDELNAFISKLNGEVQRTKRQLQGLLDTTTQMTHQMEALKQNLKEEQMEKVLKRQVLRLQSSLNQQEQTSKAAQNCGEQVERQKLYTKVDTLKSVLDQEKCSTRGVQSQLELQEGESQELEKKEPFLTSTQTEQRSIISEDESKLQTLQDEKVGLESVVKELRCRVTEQEEMIQEQQARTQTLNQNLQTERVTFKYIIEKCHAAYVSALAQINELTKQVKDSSQENESLRNSLKEQLRTVEQKIDETNSALKQENKALEETLAINEELREQLKMQKEEKQAFQKDMLKIIGGLKNRPQIQFEKWKENIMKQHEEELRLLLEEKASAFSALKKDASKAVLKEKDELNTVISKLKGEEQRTKRQLQNLLDTITRMTHKVAALKQNLKEEQVEKEVLKKAHSALKQENKDLRETLAINERRQERVKQKKRRRRWCFRRT